MNGLTPGDSRVGFVWNEQWADAYPAMLQDRGGQIQLVVPYRSDDARLARRIEGWFLAEDADGRDSPPDEVWFSDNLGSVSLVGLRAVGGSLFSSRPVAECVLAVSFAAFSGDRGVSYASVNEMTADIEGLARWVGIRSVQHNRHPDSDEVTLTITPSVVVPLDPHLDHSLISGATWGVPAIFPGMSTVDEQGLSRTRAESPAPLAEHLDRHNAVRELLELSAWREIGVRTLKVRRRDDPITVLSGDALGPRTAEIRTYAVPPSSDATSNFDFLFDFDHVGADGFRRWLDVREQFKRGIGAMTFSLHHRGGSLDGYISDAGIGLEEIGHQILGPSPNSRWRSHYELLKAVAAECSATLPFNGATWAENSTEVYNGVKHADRRTPDLDTMVNSLRQNRIVFRAWVARRIGVPDGALLKRPGFLQQV